MGASRSCVRGWCPGSASAWVVNVHDVPIDRSLPRRAAMTIARAT